jgi:hypothetical protein
VSPCSLQHRSAATTVTYRHPHLGCQELCLISALSCAARSPQPTVRNNSQTYDHHGKRSPQILDEEAQNLQLVPPNRPSKQKARRHLVPNA